MTFSINDVGLYGDESDWGSKEVRKAISIDRCNLDREKFSTWPGFSLKRTPLEPVIPNVAGGPANCARERW